MPINRFLQTLCYMSVLTIGLSSAKLKRGYYPGLIDFCSNEEVYVGIPWNCNGYLHCQNANGLKMPFWIDCPATLYYNYDSKTCTWPQNSNQPCQSTQDVVRSFCPNHPTVQVLHPDNCAQYYDCSNMNNLPNQPAYLNECPYPKLFNAETLRCDDYASVDCGDRKEPLSPCDYVRHQCSGPDCTPCTDLVPGCEGVPNGPTSYQGRLLTKFYLMCRNNKTESIEICRDGVFDPVLGRCTRDVDPRAVDILCTTNPNARMEHPGICSKFFDCRDKKRMIKECPYPRLYSPTKQACLDFKEVQCDGRIEYKAPCDYEQYQCSGSDCPVCELENPSCEGLPDGKNAFLGREQTPWHIECEGERTINRLTCPGNNNFDPVNRRCLGQENIRPTLFPEKAPYDPEELAMQAINGIPPMIDVNRSRPPPPNVPNPVNTRSSINVNNLMGSGSNNQRSDFPRALSTMNEVCRGNEGLLLMDPNNCARYFNCSRYAVQYEGFELNQDECPYPQLFSVESGFCEDFLEVNCKGRFIPKAPCQYLNSQRFCEGPMCALPCDERSPSCEGMRDGNNTFIGRELSPFYITCFKERTISVGICRYGVYDPNLRICTTELDPYSVDTFCKKRPTRVFPHIANCARYYNCSSMTKDPVLGRYLRECPYPELFNIESLSCVQREAANCRWRYEPRDPCEWKKNQYCEDPNCVPCAVRYNGCRQKPDGNHAVPNNNFEYLECQNGNVLSLRSCAPNTYDPINAECSMPEYNCENLPDGRNPMPGNEMGYILCQKGIYAGKDSCSPNFYDSVNRICRPRADTIPCDGLADGIHPMPKSNTDFIRCEGNVLVDSGSCSPDYFDPVMRKCTTTLANRNQPREAVSRTGLLPDGGLPNIPIPPPSFRPTTRVPPVLRDNPPPSELDCTGKQDGFNPIPGSATEFYICNNNRFIGYDTCKPYIFDFEQRSCAVAPCMGMPDGPTAIPGNNVFFIVCENNKMSQLRSCSPLVFDPISQRCVDERTPQFNPSDPVAFCTENPLAIMAHPDNCARYIDCTNRNSLIGQYQHECKYPDLFDSYNNSCKSYREVNCGTRPEPKAPCDYKMNLICKDPSGSCPSCEAKHPSCIGKRDGPQAVPGKPNFFMECMDERTKRVTQCPVLAPNFDPALGTCSMGLDSLNPTPYCKSNPSAVVPHPDNCHQYIDCRQKNTPLGNYLQECPYPLLVSENDTNTGTPCQPFDLVSCGLRMEPVSPCDYEFSHKPCNEADPSKCVPCNIRLPSCRNLLDGTHAHPTMPNKYLICKSERTLRVMTCPKGVFDEAAGQCRAAVDSRNPIAYCKRNPNERLPDPDNCARFFECSLPNSKYGSYVDECEYPKLYDSAAKRCRPFMQVNCGRRRIPIDPCEYIQNEFCPPGQPNCKPCRERIPSCRGLPNGNNTAPGHEGGSIYITCFNNRTIFVRTCEGGVFDPITRSCVSAAPEISPANPEAFCQVNPGMKLEHPTDCSKYYDCSRPNGAYGRYLFECKYPDLYDQVSKRCETFRTVNCGARTAPLNPCDYLQNRCKPGDRNCIPCRERLPSCVGLKNGNNTIPGRDLTDTFVVCWEGRTVSVEQCPAGYFDPVQRKCRTEIGAAVIRAYCTAHPGEIRANPVNCGQYFDCGEESIKQRTFLRECPYPHLFHAESSTCMNFTMVDCGKRREYTAPCDYLQNRCPPSNPSCKPCRERHFDCSNLPDGLNPISLDTPSSNYALCFQGRTIVTEACKEGIFDPRQRRCIGRVTEATPQRREFTEDMVKQHCRDNRMAILPHPFQCAQYYDCRRVIGNSHLRECKYPQLFDESTMTCRNFTDVNCGERTEPRAPCDYLQNHCEMNATDCTPCEERLPSCINLPDNNNPYPNKPNSEYYIKCYRNRTVSVEACQVSKYNPATRDCSDRVDRQILGKFCRENPNAIIQDPENCARYYNCSEPSMVTGLDRPYLRECSYPKLFASPAVGCQLFMMVDCAKRRRVPMSPCEYVENQCFGANCERCESKFPSCVGKEDGSNIFPGRENTGYYIVCYRQRTVAIVSCNQGIYSHSERACVGDPNPKPRLQ
ncbi:uncharacterized protein LOC133192909 isoform X1 [Saccostrea echinata]|uniref:uncharacterized protein LOC133192909 isoform X1 n=1 Tax=Saccostrea echinata TaxID=191078 RepID=UPI002A81891C|nr:uncharacterized protein LOC133192909 isoform X1 [Saccostrea echinata]